MSAATSILADLGQTLGEGDLGYHMLETVIDGDLDPDERAVLRSLVRLWRCGDYVYFGLSPHGALEAARAVTS
jgi:hypothetical protein